MVRRIFLILHRVRITGRENIPEGGAVVCGNHTAQHDPVFVICAFGIKQHLIPLSKNENETKPGLGWALKKLGVIFVDRAGADLGAIKRSMQMLKGGGKLLIFPEGTRVKPGKVVEVKNGAAMLACRCNVPLVPVFITSGRKPLFSRVNVIIGEPFYVKSEGKPTGEFLDEQTKILMDRIFALGVSK
jgi:1-acyl-sn-glycerol-3-phosphate acyltransferase